MTITVSGRAVLLLSTGLWICLAGPSPYAANAATDAPGAHHLKKSTHRASSDDANKTAEATKTDDGAAPASSADLPPAVANANAQLAAADSATPQTAAGTAAPPEQLSDADRAVAGTPATAPVAEASQVATASPAVTAESGDGSTWDKTSLIGKIFVGCGALLTMASAARMFWA
jgi:hypothetical protein